MIAWRRHFLQCPPDFALNAFRLWTELYRRKETADIADFVAKRWKATFELIGLPVPTKEDASCGGDLYETLSAQGVIENA